MPWKLAAIVTFLAVGRGWCLTTLESQCVTDFTEELNNDYLVGIWHRVVLFTIMGASIPTAECPTFIYQKPNSTELERYKAEYLKPNIPFSFDDNPIQENAGTHRAPGLVIGIRQAKFSVLDPNTHFFRPPFEVRIFQRISDEFILYHECNFRGHRRWLMSRTRNPSREQVEGIVNSRPEIANMRRQWFCV